MQWKGSRSGNIQQVTVSTVLPENATEIMKFLPIQRLSWRLSSSLYSYRSTVILCIRKQEIQWPVFKFVFIETWYGRPTPNFVQPFWFWFCFGLNNCKGNLLQDLTFMCMFSAVWQMSMKHDIWHFFHTNITKYTSLHSL